MANDRRPISEFGITDEWMVEDKEPKGRKPLSEFGITDEWTVEEPTPRTPAEENIAALVGLAQKGATGLLGVPGGIQKAFQAVGKVGESAVSGALGAIHPRAGEAAESFFQRQREQPWAKAELPTSKQIEGFLPEALKEYTEPTNKISKAAQNIMERGGRALGWTILTGGGYWMLPMFGAVTGGLAETATGKEFIGDITEAATLFGFPAARYIRAKLRPPGLGGKLNVIKEANTLKTQLETEQKDLGRIIKDFSKGKKVTPSQTSPKKIELIKADLIETAGTKGQNEELVKQINKVEKIYKKPIVGTTVETFEEPISLIGAKKEPLTIPKTRRVPKPSKKFKVSAPLLRDNIEGLNEIIYNPNTSSLVKKKAMEIRNILKEDFEKLLTPEMSKQYEVFNDVSEGLFNVKRNLENTKAMEQIGRHPDGHNFLTYLAGHALLKGEPKQALTIASFIPGLKKMKEWMRFNRAAQNTIIDFIQNSPRAQKIWSDLMRGFETANEQLIIRSGIKLGEMVGKESKKAKRS